MYLLRRSIALTAVGASIATLATGCGPSKVAQCNQLAEAINKGTPLVSNFQQESAKSSSIFANMRDINGIKQQSVEAAAVFNKFADDWDNLNQEIEGLEFKDEKIIGYQQRYVQSGEQLTQGLRDMGQVMTNLSTVEQSPAGLQTLRTVASDFSTAAQKLMSVGQEGSQVVNELNTYCGATS